MARDNVTVLEPVQEGTASVEVGVVTKQAVTQANGIKIVNALKNKNNSLQITIENTYTSAASTLTIKAGNEYPNKMLGDLNVSLGQATANSGAAATPKLTVVILEDISRFENRDGSICLDFSANFTGNVWAVAKRAGMEAASNQ